MSEKKILHALQGHVKHQGLPVAGVAVRVYPPNSSGSGTRNEPPIVEVVTGTKGEYSFQLQPGSYSLELVPNGTTRFLKERIAQIDLNANTTCNINLKTGSVLKGCVLTNRGERLVGCEVIALGIEPSSYATLSQVDANGTYNLVLPRGRFHIATRCSAAGELGDGASDPHAKPILETNGKAGGRSGSKTTDENLLPPQRGEAAKAEKAEAVATADSNGFLSFPYVSRYVAVVDVVVDDEYELVLPALEKLQGEVKDVFGQAVARASCKFYPHATNQQILLKELALYAECTTDAQGKFEVYLEPGFYDIEITPVPGSTHFALKQSNVKIAGEQFTRFTLEEGHKLRGEVLFEDTPLPDCLVRLQEVDGIKEYIAKTDGQGQFMMGVPGGSYKMVVVAHPKNAPTVTIDGAEHTGIAPWSNKIVVGGDTHVAVSLKSGTALRGRVQDDSNQARAGMNVSVFADVGQKICREEAELALAHSITDIEGRYSIFLAPGRYLLVVHKDFENATPVIVEDEPVNLDITWHGWCQVKFELSGEDGQKVPRCQVDYRPYGDKEDDDNEHPDEQSGMPRGYVLTDDEGRCQITIPQGVYSFKFSPPSSGSYEQKHIRQLSISSDLVRKVVLAMKDRV